MLGHIVSMPAPRRASSGHSIVMASRQMEQRVFSLRSRGVLVRAVDGSDHSANLLLVGKAIETALNLPKHCLRVTKHHPEDFFIYFDVPAHRDRAVALGCIDVEGRTFLLQGWRESEHGVFQTYNLHVRVCVERMPLHLWSLEGAHEVLGDRIIIDRLDSRTYAQENTKLFSCWVWCRDLSRIPGRHAFTVFPRGARRVEEMNGFLPPRHEVAPPPEGIRFDVLVHVDLSEDWTVRDRRTPPNRIGSPDASIGGGAAGEGWAARLWVWAAASAMGDEKGRERSVPVCGA